MWLLHLICYSLCVSFASSLQYRFLFLCLFVPSRSGSFCPIVILHQYIFASSFSPHFFLSSAAISFLSQTTVFFSVRLLSPSLFAVSRRRFLLLVSALCNHRRYAIISPESLYNSLILTLVRFVSFLILIHVRILNLLLLACTLMGGITSMQTATHILICISLKLIIAPLHSLLASFITLSASCLSGSTIFRILYALHRNVC